MSEAEQNLNLTLSLLNRSFAERTKLEDWNAPDYPTLVKLMLSASHVEITKNFG